MKHTAAGSEEHAKCYLNIDQFVQTEAGDQLCPSYMPLDIVFIETSYMPIKIIFTGDLIHKLKTSSPKVVDFPPPQKNLLF